ncbi:hypothetical protein [Gallaecimonas pentaromativorans]|uniref:hypothetical protein n=1 Tax=Gallaecimonas pentaromativorans TaxID=584787 RepID=UPI003A906760
MKNINNLLIFIALLLSGCTSQPTVYVYAKYLNNNQREAIINTFEKSDKYHVEINDFDFPTDITENTLLYSLLIQKPESIDIVSSLSASAGFSIQQKQFFNVGNHWYTKDSIALFLFPKTIDNDIAFFKQDLINDYKAQNCGTATSLKLNKNGSFNLESLSQGGDNVIESIDGIWKYRQYPYLELQKKGSPYADYYFEIRRSKGADKVSEIEFLELVSLNTSSLPEGCSFLIGTRI